MAKEIEKSLGDEKTRSGKENAGPEQDTARSLGDSQTLVGGLAADTEELNDGLELTDLSARYTIVRSLGQGGMGEVLLATDNRLKRQVAIKRIRGEQARSRAALQRFLTEAQAIAALNHPNIVQVYDYGRDQEGPFLIMEYVDGQSLLERCKDNPLPVEQAVELACELLGGLGRAHELGIIHRDIKPANILLTKDGRPKLTDFGLAKQMMSDHGQTVTGTVLGTIDFMPPEQRRDATLVDARSDLWSLAATIYQMLTGKSPKVIRVDLLPPHLAAAIGRSLEENAASRFQSAAEFRDALRGTETKSKPATEIILVPGQCPNCGIRSNSPGKFCRECSAPLKVPCLQCGKEMPVWDKGCTECGSRQSELLQARKTELLQTQARIEVLREKRRYLEALRIADSIGELKHPQFNELNLWLDNLRPALREQARHLELVATAALEEARAHRNAWDYRSAVQALKNLPLEARVAEHRDFMEQLQKDFSESQKIVQEIQRRVNSKQLDDLLPLVRRGLELRGDREDLIRLSEQLEQRERMLSGDAIASPPVALDDPFPMVEEAVTALAPLPSVKLNKATNWLELSKLKFPTIPSLPELPAIPLKRVLEGLAIAISLLALLWVFPELAQKLSPRSTSEIKNSIDMRFKLVPAGEFQMGSPSDEAGRSMNELRHKVRISKPYYMGISEVTQQDYVSVTDGNPSAFQGADNPVEQVNWMEAVEFCKKLSELPAEKAAGRSYRLPTEAEWEYACRASKDSPYCVDKAGVDLVDIAWYALNSRVQSQRVGKRLPNRWGLYDMAGNVFEWCSDWLTDYPADAVTDPKGPEKGFNRIVRGGSWRSQEAQCRSAFRDGRPPTEKSSDIGFRVVMVIGN